ncbi:hypothetical protein AB1Y20_008591 [Prymnesium parvum]|uniref:Uncharacterized protein n=1 Tax=Prymnesium parvum TaxID=97485 RepID=A0AB34IUC7_PRYPA
MFDFQPIQLVVESTVGEALRARKTQTSLIELSAVHSVPNATEYRIQWNVDDASCAGDRVSAALYDAMLQRTSKESGIGLRGTPGDYTFTVDEADFLDYEKEKYTSMRVLQFMLGLNAHGSQTVAVRGVDKHYGELMVETPIVQFGKSQLCAMSHYWK